MKKNDFISEQGQLGGEILLNIAETLALRLPEGSERTIAAKWVKKFLACDPNAYKHNLSLFICSLTKQVLVEPFDKAPAEPRNQWQEFDKEYTMDDIRDAARIRLFKDTFTPEYKVEISQDMKEYCAFQEIPHFGAHFYYAFSPGNTINEWSKFNKLNIPRRHVIALEKAGKIQKELEESPVKGRFTKKPKGGAAKKKEKVKAEAPKEKKSDSKPKWEGPIEEEPEPEREPESPKKTMICIPTDVPAKNIPPALQRRMLEAEQKRQERLASKDEEHKKQLARAKTPTGKSKLKKPSKAPKKVATAAATSPGPSTSASGTPKPRDSLRKTLLQKKASSRGESLLDEFSDAEELKEYGPLNRSEFYKEYINKKKEELKADVIPPEIHGQILKTSTAMNNEVNRAIREFTPNLTLVNAIQDQEIDIGQKLLKAFDADNRMESVLEVAASMKNEFRDMWNNLSKLNKSRAIPVVSPKTVNKFQELKKRASIIPQEIAAIAEPDFNENLVDIEAEPVDYRKEAESILDAIDQAAEVSLNAIEHLQAIQPKSPSDREVINSLIASNNTLIENVEVLVPELINAIEDNASDLMKFTHIVATDLSKSIIEVKELDKSAANLAVPTDVALQAADVQDEKNAQLDEVLNQTKINFDEDYANYAPKDPRVRSYFGHDIEEELIDVDEVDVDFEGGIVDDEKFLQSMREERAMQSEREKSRYSSMFASVADEAQIEDVEDEFGALLDESLEAIDEVVDALEKSEEDAAGPNQLTEIQNIKQKAKEYAELLRRRTERAPDNQTRVGRLRENFEKPSNKHFSEQL